MHNKAKECPYKCPKCPKAFHIKCDMTRHAKVHEARRVKCFICEKRFFSQGTLKLQITVVHEGQKPYECDICGNHFGQKGSLNKHMRVSHKLLELNGEREMIKRAITKKKHESSAQEHLHA